MRFTQNPHSHFSFTFSSISPLSFLLSLSSSFLFLPDSLFCQKYIQFYDRTIRGEITTYSIYIRYFHFDVAIHTSATRAVDRFLYTQLTSRHFPQSVILFGVRSFEGNMHIHSPTWLRVADSLLYTGENVEVLNACVPQQTGNEFHIINTVTWKKSCCSRGRMWQVTDCRSPPGSSRHRGLEVSGLPDSSKQSIVLSFSMPQVTPTLCWPAPAAYLDLPVLVMRAVRVLSPAV